MADEILRWLQHGIPVDQATSQGVTLLTALGLGLFFGAVPAGASELLAIAAGAVTPRSMIVPLLLVLTLGHVLGKVLWYWLGTLGPRIRHPRAQAWVTNAHHFAEQHPALGVGTLFSSAVTSVPPFHMTVIAAGVVHMPIPVFITTAFVGRLLRFGLVALMPGLLRFAF
jgi:membrane protein YqaA with SNARE-associated domain